MVALPITPAAAWSFTEENSSSSFTNANSKTKENGGRYLVEYLRRSLICFCLGRVAYGWWATHENSWWREYDFRSWASNGDGNHGGKSSTTSFNPQMKRGKKVGGKKEVYKAERMLLRLGHSVDQIRHSSRSPPRLATLSWPKTVCILVLEIRMKTSISWIKPEKI